ncbi:16840_t:CDS:1, partial [Funneliformis caledonium]
KEVEYDWTNERQNVFETLKGKLMQASILRYPDFDKMFYLFTDVSGIGLEAVLA